MKKFWVLDVDKNEALDLIQQMRHSDPDHFPQHSGYITGKAKIWAPNKIGIYFIDPTRLQIIYRELLWWFIHKFHKLKWSKN